MADWRPSGWIVEVKDTPRRVGGAGVTHGPYKVPKGRREAMAISPMRHVPGNVQTLSAKQARKGGRILEDLR